MTPKHLVLTIARAAGWFDLRPNAAQRCHNPGNLTQAPTRFAQAGKYRYGRWCGEREGRLIRFQCGGEGFAALENALRSAWTRSESLADVVSAHAPGTLDTVAGWLGVHHQANLRLLIREDWPVIPGAWKNFPPPGELPRWPLESWYLATLGCESDEPDPRTTGRVRCESLSR